MSINFLTHQWAKKDHFKSVFFKKTTSTNDMARSLFPETGEDFCLYLADHQSRGRGRKGGSWKNLNRGEILLSTWCFKPEQNPQPILTPLLGLALRSSLLEVQRNMPLRIKAPNDLYLDNAKVAGLLIESIQQGSDCFLLIGLGLNVFDSPRLSHPTTFLARFVKINDDFWFSFCARLYRSFLKAVKKGQKNVLCHGDTQKLKSALNFGLSEDKKYSNVSPNCDLTGPGGVISWTDL